MPEQQAPASSGIFLPMTPDSFYPGTFQSYTTFPEQTDKVVQQQSFTEMTLDLLVKGVPSAVAGAVDTVGQSLGITAEGDMQKLLSNLSAPLGQYYGEHEYGAKFAGDIAFSFVPVIGASRLIRTGSYLQRAAEAVAPGNQFVQAMFSTGKSSIELTQAAIDRAAVLAGKRGKDFSVDAVASDAAYVAAMRGAKRTAALDAVKEGLAADVAIALTMSDSQVFFPDELSRIEQAGMFLVPDALYAGVAYAATRAMLSRRLVQEIAPLAAKAENPQGLNVNDVLYRADDGTGTISRGAGITVQSTLRQTAQDELSRAGNDTTLRTNLNNEITSYTAEIRNQAYHLMNDNPIPGLTGNAKLKAAPGAPVPGEINTVDRAVEKDPQLLFYARSLEPYSDAYRMDFSGKKTEILVEYDNQLNLLRSSYADITNPLGATAQQIDRQQARLDALRQTGAVVIEPDGSIAALRQRKPIFQDGDRKVQTVATRGVEPEVYQIKYKETDKTVTIGVNAGLHVLLPKIEANNVVINRQNVTAIVQEPTQYSENTRLLLQDIGHDWHTLTGTRGKQLFATLPQPLRSAIGAWVGSSGSSPIRAWFSQGAPEAKQLYDAGEPIRARLREIAEADGTIPLFRGERTQETNAPTNDVVSMTADPNVAKRFAKASGYNSGNVVVRHVPVDDVVMVIGGLGDEVEYIVKNNLSRVFGDQTPISQSSFEALDLYGRSAVYAAGQKALEKYDPAKGDPIYFSLRDHHMRLDMILQLIEKHGDAILPKLKQIIPGKDGFQLHVSPDEIAFASLVQKFDEYSRLRQLQTLSENGLLKFTEEQRLSLNDITKMLNLPGSDFTSGHPLVQLFEDLYRAGGNHKLDSLFKDLSQVKEAMVRLVAPDSVGQPLRADLALRGNMLDIPYDSKPVVMLYKNPEGGVGYITRDMLVDKVAMNRNMVVEQMKLAGQNGAGLVAEVAGQMLRNPAAFAAASRVDLLREGTQLGTDFIQQPGFVNRNNPVIQATDILSATADRGALQYIRQQFDAHPVFHDLLSRKYEGDMASLALAVHARRQGWELLKDADAGPNGGFFLKLDPDSAFNKQRWKELYKTDMPNESYMPGIDGRPLLMSARAMDGLLSIDAISSDILSNINYLRHLQGRGPINRKLFHIPAVNLAQKDLVFLVKENGQLHTVASGNSMAEALRTADSVIANSSEHLAKFTKDDVARYYDLQNEAFVRPVNYANPRLQTGRATGKSVAPEVPTMGQEVLREIIDTLQHQYDSVVKETKGLMFEPELSYAKHQLRSSGAAEKAGVRQTIWDQYQNRVFGVQTQVPNSNIGRLYGAVESAYDTILQRVWDAKFAAREGAGVISGQQAREYEKLKDTLGEGYTPFTNIADYAERTARIVMPPTLRQNAGQLNSIIGALALRIFDVGMAAINVLSLGSTLPPVIKMMQKMPGETKEQWVSRINAWGAPIDENLAVWNPTRAIMSGINYWYSPQSKALIDLAEKRGYLEQDIVERLRTFAAPAEGYAAQMIRKSTNVMSWLTDKSEKWSRGVAYVTGLNLAKNGLKLDDEAASLFAYNFANKTIADFRPSNRPQIFQGAAGMPLGLFTTWMWNFLQRVFSTVENKQMGAILNQVGMQYALFGSGSMPGFNSYVQTFTANYDGTSNFMDRFDRAFGSTATDVFLQGTVSNLPRLFGADTGVAIYSRGDVQVPVLTRDFSVPAASFLTNIYQATSASIKAAVQAGGIDSKQQMEILAAYSMNRAFRNGVELYTGQSVDRSGALIAQDVNTGIAAAARLIGFRTSQEEMRRAELGRIKMIDQYQADLLDGLSKQIRSDLRGGIRGSELQSNLAGYLRDYIRAGGKPQHFRSYLANQVLIGNVEKSTRELMEALRAGNRAGEAERLLLLTQ